MGLRPLDINFVSKMDYSKYQRDIAAIFVRLSMMRHNGFEEVIQISPFCTM